MKNSGKIIKEALEYMTQCVLLPGVELHFDDVMHFYKRNFNNIGKRFKYISVKASRIH